MYVQKAKRYEYWNHFIQAWLLHKAGGGNGITARKLAAIKAEILADNEFWQDVVWRHNGADRTPEQMKAESPDTYEHCQGNFWGMVMQTLVERGLVR